MIMNDTLLFLRHPFTNTANLPLSCKADRKMQFCLAPQTDSRSLKAG